MGFFSEKTITYKNSQVRVQENYPEIKKREGEGGRRWITLLGGRGGLCDFNKFDSSKSPKRCAHDASKFIKITLCV